MIESIFHGSLRGGSLTLLLVSLAIALGFEFVNGFHDTANAVATVIYTRTLRPRAAVFWSGFCNFCGVYLGGTAVAFSIVNLLPVELLVQSRVAPSLSMVMALLLAAITWNLGTWYLGIPASSSHTLIGAILGVGLANAWLSGGSPGAGVNWMKAGEVGLSLLLSPLIGFALAAVLLRLLKKVAPDPALHEPPPGDQPPPRWIRAILIFTCTGVSFAHGSNDGQKGIGLIMLILIGILPAQYALDLSADQVQIHRVALAAGEIQKLLPSEPAKSNAFTIHRELDDVRMTLENAQSIRDLPESERWRMRTDLLRVSKGLGTMKQRNTPPLPREDWQAIDARRALLQSLTEYTPTWVLVAVATALGVGTTVGWKRIVETVGEKIGKSHLTYSQGACAELVAMTTIGLADVGGLPVSTTHVLSSGVAGTMVANGSGLQWKTVRNIALAWLLTLPVSMILAACLFAAFQYMIQ